MNCMRRLLSLYKSQPCLYKDSSNPITFEWINRSDAMRSTISFMRRNPWNYNSALLSVCNFSPVEYTVYTCGAPLPGSYRRLFSTYDDGEDAALAIRAEKKDCDGYPYTLSFTLRPYESVVFSLPYVRKPRQSDSDNNQ